MSFVNQLKDVLSKACKELSPEFSGVPEINSTPDRKFGDYATNVALQLAKPLKQKPRDIAEKLKTQITAQAGFLQGITVDGPGFLNFRIKPESWIQSLSQIATQKSLFGNASDAKNKKVVVEFVSANPTGPLHIGNARGGPLGDVIAALLQAQGYDVTREFYLNDVGGQIEKLGMSILLRSKSRLEKSPLNEEALGYQGLYVDDLATKAIAKWNQEILQWGEAEAVEKLGLFGIAELTAEIRRDCGDMGIVFDSWIYEKDILSSKKTDRTIAALKEKNVTQTKEGALWFVPHDEFLSDRECVLVKSNGMPTYFANDIAYHADKYDRGFDRLINIWGSNHHGHVPRVQAGVKALGYDADKIETVLYQYVRVKRGEEAVKMSKRGGNFVLLREVLDEVGKDALRFFLLFRSPESHMDFDLELAKKETSENPIYYIQYAHARICSIFEKANEKGSSAALPSSTTPCDVPTGTPQSALVGRLASESFSLAFGKYDPIFERLLNLPEEIEISQFLMEYPAMIEKAASHMAPHHVAHYLLELAGHFQSYYDKARHDGRYKVIVEDQKITQAKLFLLYCVRQVLQNGLKLLGLSAPEKM